MKKIDIATCLTFIAVISISVALYLTDSQMVICKINLIILLMFNMLFCMISTFINDESDITPVVWMCFVSMILCGIQMCVFIASKDGTYIVFEGLMSFLFYLWFTAITSSGSDFKKPVLEVIWK